MSKRKVDITPKFDKQFGEFYDYIRKESPQNAEKFVPCSIGFQKFQEQKKSWKDLGLSKSRSSFQLQTMKQKVFHFLVALWSNNF